MSRRGAETRKENMKIHGLGVNASMEQIAEAEQAWRDERQRVRGLSNADLIAYWNDTTKGAYHRGVAFREIVRNRRLMTPKELLG